MSELLHTGQVEQILEIAQREIAFCEHCQPNGARMPLQKFLAQLGVPANEQEYLAESLECNHCGAVLELVSAVEIRPANKKNLDDLWRQWEAKFEDRFQQFHEFLEEYPTLGAHHALGRQLGQILSEAARREIAEATFFAASKVSNSHSLRQQEMMPLDPAVFPIPEGRYNHAGQAVLLLVDSLEGAAREILHREEKLAWIQRFRVQRCKGILDLSSPRAFGSHPDLELIAFGLGFYGTKKPSAHAAHERKPEYSVARFVADCTRHQSFSGIRCKSTKHYANNLILFAWHDDLLTPVGEPQLCNLNQPDHVFHSLSEMPRTF